MSGKRVSYLSAINVIATISVVILHANVNFWSFNINGFWPVANVIECVFYFAVPVFFMLTGATLIDYSERYSTKTFFKKRFFKTVIPFFTWSLFAGFWVNRTNIIAAISGGAPLNWTFLTFYDGIINSKFYQIYWFFMPLFCIYLAMPLFAFVQKEKKMKLFEYLIVISLILNLAIPFVIAQIQRYGGLELKWPLTIYSTSQFLFYVPLGYVLKNREFKLKGRLIIYAAALAGLLVHIIGTYELSKAEGKIVTFYKSYYYLPCVLYSAGIFLLLKQLFSRVKSESVNAFFAKAQSYAFPIYLIHRYILDLLEELSPKIGIEKGSFLFIIPAVVISILLSVLITMLLRKIPVIRHTVP